MDGGMGHNNPPDPVEEVVSQYDDIISEAQNWTDGTLVENEGQMKAVDGILKQFKTYKSALTKAGKERTDPFHKRWKAEVAAVKLYIDDADRIQRALVACVAPFKEKLAAKKREEERKAWEAAEAKRKEAEQRAAEANAADLDAQREAARAAEEAMEAERAAKAATKAKPKGMRTVHHFEVTDMRALINWIAQNDKAAMADFGQEYARQNHRAKTMAGVETWQTKEAF